MKKPMEKSQRKGQETGKELIKTRVSIVLEILDKIPRHVVLPPFVSVIFV